MKRKIFSLSLICLLGCAATYAASFAEVSINADGIYVPDGFDANDYSEVALTGALPNSCYSRPRAIAKLEGSEIKINVVATKNLDAKFCMQMEVPFVAVAPIGHLAAKRYAITANNGPHQLTSSLKVNEPESTDVDNYVYAHIESVSKIDGTRKVVLTGTNPSDCLELKNISFIVNEKNNTVSVLPIMQQIRTSCPQMPSNFKYTVRVPHSVQEDKVMLHIRSMDGHAINYLFEE